MITGMILQAPAKLNLSLRVLRRRDDGFHEIDSLMVQLPGLHDVLEIERAEHDSFSCNVPGVPADDSNLVMKALAAIRKETASEQCWSVRLEKRIPHGAGLGGGSSDAAFALDGFNRGLGEPVEKDRLLSMAAELGSDVPFFLGEPVARVTGRGESLESHPPINALPVLLLKPSFGVSTPDAYRAWKDSLEIPGVCYEKQERSGLSLVNDLERPVFAKHRFLAEMKMWLLNQPEVLAAMMSGSGSTMFAVLTDLEMAEVLLERALRDVDPHLWGWSGWTAGLS